MYSYVSEKAFPATHENHDNIENEIEVNSGHELLSSGCLRAG